MVNTFAELREEGSSGKEKKKSCHGRGKKKERGRGSLGMGGKNAGKRKGAKRDF